MADELSRMKNAADLLSNSQDQVDAVVRSSEAIVDKAGDFAEHGAEIIQRLSRMDLETRLGEVTRNVSELQALMERQLDRLNEALEELDERNSEIVKESSKALKQELSASVDALEKSIGDDMAELTDHVKEEIARAREERHKLFQELGRNANNLENKQKVLMGMNALTLIAFLGLVIAVVWL
jgi:DNA anti-recombination protein RmuC